jgi:hypothetical protein
MAQERIGHAFRCQTDDAISIVIPSEQRERGISPTLRFENSTPAAAQERLMIGGGPGVCPLARVL